MLLVVSTRAARGAGAGLLASARTQRVPCVGGSLKQAACVALGSGENMRTLAWALFLKKSSRNSMFLGAGRAESRRVNFGIYWCCQDPVSYLFSASAEHGVSYHFI